MTREGTLISHVPGTEAERSAGLQATEPHSTMAFGCLYASWKGEVAPLQLRLGLGGVSDAGRSPGVGGHRSSLRISVSQHSLGLQTALLLTDPYRILKYEYVTLLGFSPTLYQCSP